MVGAFDFGIKINISLIVRSTRRSCVINNDISSLYFSPNINCPF